MNLKVFINCFHEFWRAVGIASSDRLGGDLQEALYLVQPRCVRWSEV
jgi:hypothetical protein